MAKKDNKKKGHGLTYFLDHPQIQRHKSVGNQDPKPATKSTWFGGTKTSAQSGGASQTVKESETQGATGNIKTNLGKLLGGK